VSETPEAARTGKRGYPLLVLLPWLCAIMAYWIIVAVDPFHLRHDGPVFRLGDNRYPDTEWPYMIYLATLQSHDVVLLAGSTAMPITTDMMQEAFPGARSPINLSYLAPRPLDMPQILPRIAHMAGLKRVILFMDWTLLDSGPYRSPTGQIWESLAKTNWSHSADFSIANALGSLHAVRSGTYELPIWYRHPVPDFMLRGTPVTEHADVMKQFREAAQRHADDVFAKSTLTCRKIPYVQTVLVPFMTEMANKHIAVDLVFPAIPYVLYYYWIEHRNDFNILLPGPLFDQFMVFKRCVVAARDQVGVDSNRIIAIDTDDAMSGDLRRYVDSIHLIDPEAYRTELRMIADGDETITSANIDRREADLRSKVAQAGAQLRTH
jgi:hypothetical protein